MDNGTPLQTAARGSLREPDAGAYVGYSRPYLRQCRMRGTGPAYVRVGRSIRYLTTDLDTWLAQHRVDPSRPRRCA